MRFVAFLSLFVIRPEEKFLTTFRKMYGTQSLRRPCSAETVKVLNPVVDIVAVFDDRWQHCRSISGRRLHPRRLVRLRNRKRLRRKCHGGVRSGGRRHRQLSTRCARYVYVSLSTCSVLYIAHLCGPSIVHYCDEHCITVFVCNCHRCREIRLVMIFLL